MSPKTIIMMGRPGAGKGTQLARLAQRLEDADERTVFRFETGRAFRELAAGKSHTSDMVRETLNKGVLQPVFLSVWLWGGEFVKNLEHDEHIIMDGFPRRVAEAEVLETALAFYKREQVDVVFLDVTDEVAIERMMGRGRDDDALESAQYRLQVYHEQIDPVLDFYREHTEHRFHQINADNTEDAVQQTILEVLNIP